MEWASVFDEAHPEQGATDADIDRFLGEIARPISAEEVRAINAGQSNPFPKRDPLHGAWRPFDASTWHIRVRPPPPSYLSLLRWSDGGEFRTGARWFQFFPTLDEIHGVRAMLLTYQLPLYMPGALPVGFNGGGTFYLLDMREPVVEGEYPIVCAHAGYLGWSRDACHPVAPTFVEACRGGIDVGEMRAEAGLPG